MLSAYFIHLLILIGIYLILGLSLQLAVGFSGILNLGHIAFFGLGAYTSALLAIAGWPFLLCFLAGGLVAMGSGFVLSLLTHRIKGDYLALVTMGFCFVIYSLMLNLDSLTRGPLGLPGIPRPEILGFSFYDNFWYFILAGVMALATYLIIRRITLSPFGKLLEAVRDNELAAKILGKDTFKVKALSLALSAFFAGLAGSLYAHYITFIDPSSFSLMQIIPVISIVIVGGLASLEGTVVATFILLLIPEALRFVGFPSSILGPMRQIIYALFLLLILVFRPKGFWGRVELE
ncbi:MAG TPA: branched-chain amino acid ABC transporter permease [Candidatus Paceibacterota bacterium]|nr:branched-chain amino acid ABC transporter permease [Candidatus Paceibacterota bacterium]